MVNVYALNAGIYEKALLAKAEECRDILLKARRDTCIERAPEAIDRVLHAREREIAAERVEACFRLQKQIETALSRLKRGRYGLCLRCDERIEEKRLNALPWALFCVHCQESVDLLHERVRANGNELRQAA
jgi:DnaK suppressor protein